MFDNKSRYKKQQTYQRKDWRGRTVATIPVPVAADEEFVGYHLRKQGQRVDHMAFRYLDNAAGFWRICQLNGVMLPEALSEASDIAIPRK